VEFGEAKPSVEVNRKDYNTLKIKRFLYLYDSGLRYCNNYMQVGPCFCITPNTCTARVALVAAADDKGSDE
jgi:hypothetical protein